MDGRDFLEVARRLALEQSEADWRTAAGRAYYALLQETRRTLQDWGFAASRRDQIHAYVRLRCLYAADGDLKRIGRRLEALLALRNQADYRLDTTGAFADSKAASQAVLDSASVIDVLEKLDRDPHRRAAAISAIRNAFP